MGNKLDKLQRTLEESVKVNHDTVDLTQYKLGDALKKLKMSPAMMDLLGKFPKIDMSNTQLSILPAQIGDLENLTHLQLEGNKLTSVPPEIGRLVHLSVLNLYKCKLSTLPDELCEMRALTKLVLHKNVIVRLPDNLGNLRCLQLLYVGGNKLITLPPSLWDCAELTEIHIQVNQIVDLTGVGRLLKLRILNARSNKLIALDSNIGNCGKLTELVLWDNKLTAIPESIGGCSSLTSLNFQENKCEKIPTSMANLRALTTLMMGGNPMKGVYRKMKTMETAAVLNELDNMRKNSGEGSPFSFQAADGSVSAPPPVTPYAPSGSAGRSETVSRPTQRGVTISRNQRAGYVVLKSCVEATQWLHLVLGDECFSEKRGVRDMNDLYTTAYLADGVALCLLLNKVAPGSIEKIHHWDGHQKGRVPPKHAGKNVKRFCAACFSFGLTVELIFEPDDLIMGWDLPAVYNTIIELSVIAEMHRFTPILRRLPENFTYKSEQIALAVGILKAKEDGAAEKEAAQLRKRSVSESPRNGGGLSTVDTYDTRFDSMSSTDSFRSIRAAPSPAKTGTQPVRVPERKDSGAEAGGKSTLDSPKPNGSPTTPTTATSPPTGAPAPAATAGTSTPPARPLRNARAASQGSAAPGAAAASGDEPSESNRPSRRRGNTDVPPASDSPTPAPAASPVPAGTSTPPARPVRQQTGSPAPGTPTGPPPEPMVLTSSGTAAAPRPNTLFTTGGGSQAGGASKQAPAASKADANRPMTLFMHAQAASGQQAPPPEPDVVTPVPSAAEENAARQQKAAALRSAPMRPAPNGPSTPTAASTPTQAPLPAPAPASAPAHVAEEEMRTSTPPPPPPAEAAKPRTLATLEPNGVRARLETAKQNEARRGVRPHMLEEGWQLDPGEVVLGKAIGRGAFGTVYIAEYEGIEVAVKAIKTNMGDSAAHVVAALTMLCDRELSILKKLRHPNILQFLGTYVLPTEPHVVFLVTEFVPNKSVAELIAAQGKSIDWRILLKLAVEAVRGLAYLHGNGVIHRDIKSENVLIGENWRAKLCDFGFARMNAAQDSSARSKAMTVCGTDDYMAPELMMGTIYTESVDVFAFGMTLLEMMTGMSTDQSNGVLLREAVDNFAVRHDAIRPHVRKDCPALFQEAVFAATAYDPRKRPTAAMMQAAFESLSGEDVAVSADKLDEVIISLLEDSVINDTAKRPSVVRRENNDENMAPSTAQLDTKIDDEEDEEEVDDDEQEDMTEAAQHAQRVWRPERDTISLDALRTRVDDLLDGFFTDAVNTDVQDIR